MERQAAQSCDDRPEPVAAGGVYQVDMIQRFPEHRFPWFVGTAMPPRDPNDDDDDETEEEDEDGEDEQEPAVIREPDEDE